MLITKLKCKYKPAGVKEQIHIKKKKSGIKTPPSDQDLTFGNLYIGFKGLEPNGAPNLSLLLL